MFAVRRGEGHLIQVGVLVSVLQKAVRRARAPVAFWSMALLLRMGFHKYVMSRLMTMASEDTNCVVEPELPGRLRRHRIAIASLIKKKKTALPQLEEMLFMVVLELLRARKSRMASTAAAHALSLVVRDLGGLTAEIRASGVAVAAYATERFKGATSVDEALRWMAVLEVSLVGKKGSEQGFEGVWEFLCCAPKCRVLYEVYRLKKDFLRHQRLLRYEAVVAYWIPSPLEEGGGAPLHSEEGGGPLHLEEHRRAFQSFLRDSPTLDTRKFLSPAEWASYLDKHTGVGKGHDTLTGLLKQHPEIRPDQWLPDAYGLAALERAEGRKREGALVRHFFEVGARVENEGLADPFAASAQAFYELIERSGVGPIRKGCRNAKSTAIMKALHEELFGDASRKRRVSSESAASSAAKRQKSAGASSSAADPGEVVFETPRIKGAVRFQLTQMPTGRKPCSWIVSFAGSSTRWIKYPVEYSSVEFPIYLDCVKERFGLESVDLRWVGSSSSRSSGGVLVGRDVGHGGNYPMVLHRTPVKSCMVLDRSRTGAVLLTALGPGDFQRDALVIRVLLVFCFRYIFCVSDTHFNNVLILRRGDALDGRVVSVDEMELNPGSFPDPPARGELLDVVFTKRPRQEILEVLEGKLCVEEVQSALRVVLNHWLRLLPEVWRSPPAKVLNLGLPFFQDRVCKLLSLV